MVSNSTPTTIPLPVLPPLPTSSNPRNPILAWKKKTTGPLRAASGADGRKPEDGRTKRGGEVEKDSPGNTRRLSVNRVAGSVSSIQSDIRINGSDGPRYNGPVHNERKYPRYANSPIIFSGQRKGEEEGGGGERKGPVEGHICAHMYPFAYIPGRARLHTRTDICIFAANTITIARQREQILLPSGPIDGRGAGGKGGIIYQGRQNAVNAFVNNATFSLCGNPKCIFLPSSLLVLTILFFLLEWRFAFRACAEFLRSSVTIYFSTEKIRSGNRSSEIRVESRGCPLPPSPLVGRLGHCGREKRRSYFTRANHGKRYPFSLFFLVRGASWKRETFRF